MKQFLYRFTAGITGCLWILGLYLLLAKRPLNGIDVPSYGAHTVFFFVLAFMTTCSQPKPKIFWTVMSLYLFGSLTEIAQHFDPPRTCSVLDFFEDVIGSSLGIFLAILWMKLLRRILYSPKGIWFIAQCKLWQKWLCGAIK